MFYYRYVREGLNSRTDSNSESLPSHQELKILDLFSSFICVYATFE